MAEAQPPSLFVQPGAESAGAPRIEAAESAQPGSSLLDLLYDGFYMIFLLRNRCAPEGAASFRERVRALNGRLEVRSAKGVGTSWFVRFRWPVKPTTQVLPQTAN